VFLFLEANIPLICFGEHFGAVPLLQFDNKHPVMNKIKLLKLPFRVKKNVA
jgi:hypothetical protein